MTIKDFFNCETVFAPSQISALKSVGKFSEELGSECKLVGGAVRDCLLGKGNKDLDFVCKKPYELAEKIADSVEITTGNRPNVPIFRKFGTAQVVYKDGNGNREELEFVLPRKETYNPDSIKPEVDTGGSFKDDAFRRDFTLNALYLGVEDDEWMKVYDLTGMGLDDLKNGLLRTPRDFDITFQDDPSRLLRLARFSSCKDFEIEQNTFESARRNREEIHRVPEEMVMQSMRRGIVCNSYVDVADKLGFLSELIPEIEEIRGLEQPKEHHIHDVWTHTKEVVNYLPPDHRIKFAGLWHDMGKGKTLEELGTFYKHEINSEEMAREWLKKYKFSKNDINDIAYLTRNHMATLYLINGKMTDKAIRRFAKKHNQEGKDYTDELIAFARADAKASGVHHEEDIERIDGLERKIFEAQEKLHIGEGKKFELAINGNDVMRVLNIPPSKRVGEVLGKLEELVIDQELSNDETELTAYLETEMKK